MGRQTSSARSGHLHPGAPHEPLPQLRLKPPDPARVRARALTIGISQRGGWPRSGGSLLVHKRPPRRGWWPPLQSSSSPYLSSATNGTLRVRRPRGASDGQLQSEALPLPPSPSPSSSLDGVRSTFRLQLRHLTASLQQTAWSAFTGVCALNN